jgi:hypothetical protein
MKGTVIEVHPLKMSRTEHAFIRIEFMFEDGKWAKTDIVTKYRNYNRWKPIIDRGVGTALANLTLRKNGEVNGDSYPVILAKPIPMEKREGADIEQQKLL